MTLDEAIRHCEEVANKCEFDTDWGMGNHFIDRSGVADEIECGKEHRQLAQWLRELKACKEQNGDTIYRQAAIDALELKKDKNAKGDIGGFYNKIIKNDIDTLMQLPSAQPEKRTEKRTETHARDCISRQAAIRIASGYCHPANIAAELAKLPPVQPEQRWIPVSERLPDYDEEVLTCIESGSVEIHRLEKGDYWEYQYGDWTTDLYEVIAWMPLPEPYKPQESEVGE
jgi:hypothetical protein